MTGGYQHAEPLPRVTSQASCVRVRPHSTNSAVSLSSTDTITKRDGGCQQEYPDVENTARCPVINYWPVGCRIINYTNRICIR